MEVNAYLRGARSVTVETFFLLIKISLSLFIAFIFGAALLVTLLGSLAMLLLAFAVFAVFTFLITIGDFGIRAMNALRFFL